jgi:uncharacterized membrane protein
MESSMFAKPAATFGQYAAAYGAALLVMGALDFVWIGILMTDFYKIRLGGMMLEQPRLGAAALFYLLYILGIIFFGTRPGLAAGSWRVAAVHSALFGVIAYATYDLTNLATLKTWFIDLTVIDMIWGGILSAIAGTAGYAAGRKLAP